MKDQRYTLQPFPLKGNPADLMITVAIRRRLSTMALRYVLQGRLDGLMIPSSKAAPSRKNGLWKETCFEFFLGVKDSYRYWEFNLSPSGDWNVYRFDAYRQGMQEEGAFASLPFHVQRRADTLLLDVGLDLSAIITAEASIEIGVSAVVKGRDHEVTYWALTHCGPEADFHRRDSFMIEFS